MWISFKEWWGLFVCVFVGIIFKNDGDCLFVGINFKELWGLFVCLFVGIIFKNCEKFLLFVGIISEEQPFKLQGNCWVYLFA